MKRYTAAFEVVDATTGNRYAPGEIITIPDDDHRFDAVLDMLDEIVEQTSAVDPPDHDRSGAGAIPDAVPVDTAKS